MTTLRSSLEIAAANTRTDRASARMALHRVPVTLTQKQFDALLEYSCSQPTGVFDGKQWKCNVNAFNGHPAKWFLCEYVDDGDPRGYATTVRLITVDAASALAPGSAGGG